MLKPVHAALVAALLSSAAFDAAVAAETTAYSYDARGRLVTVVRSGGPAGSFTSSYAIDDADNRTQVTVTQGGTVAPSFSVAAAPAVPEGTALVFTVTRNGSAAANHSISYATISGGTATSGSDFAATAGTLTFTPAQSSQTFSVATIDDSIGEATETVLVALSGATGGATISSSQASGSINDNDVAPPANTPPAAVDDTVSMMRCEQKTVDLGLNDSDADGDLPLTLTNVTQISGTPDNHVMLAGGTSVEIWVTSITGTSTYSYTLRDARGATDTGTLTVTVGGGFCS